MTEAKESMMIFVQNGTLPLAHPRYDGKLTQAFKDRKSEILFIAADLGHYIVDAHMPLQSRRTIDRFKFDL
jgi:hypothetical protein